MGNGQTVMDSIKGIHYGEENDEIYLVVVVVDAGKARRKPSCSELRRPIYGAMSGGSKNGLYF